MAIFRIEKTSNYTVMSNYHLKERAMSLKAKGLLTLMLSLPDDWDYSIEGLVAICKENETAIKSTLKELKDFGYVEVNKLMPNQTKSGRIEYIYNIYEQPRKQGVEKQGVENLGVEFQPVENQGQLITNKLNTNKLNTKDKKKKPQVHKESYGELGNVKLTIDEYNRLIKDYGEALTLKAIEYLDGYIADKKYKSSDNNRAMRRWVFDAVREQEQKRARLNSSNNKNSFMQNTYDFDALEAELRAN